MRLHLHRRHLTTEEVDPVWRAVQTDDGSDLADNLAVTIASWWQSPGRPGRHLAALASGAPVAPDALAEDVSATILEAEALAMTSDEDLAMLRWLGEWVDDWTTR